MSRFVSRARTILFGCALAGVAVIGYGVVRREALWVVVQGCAVAQTVADTPFPCLAVARNPSGFGTAILRQPLTATHTILVPLAGVRGIEAPILQGRAGVVYWNAALQARSVVVEASGGIVSQDDVGLAVNSADGRSQDQLHIHLDCIRPSVRTALRDWLPAGDANWSPVPLPIADARYLARRISASEVARFNPFAVIAGVGDWRSDMRNVTFAAFALPAAEGGDWVLLAQHLSGSSAEHLLDPFCRVARARSANSR